MHFFLQAKTIQTDKQSNNDQAIFSSTAGEKQLLFVAEKAQASQWAIRFNNVFYFSRPLLLL